MKKTFSYICELDGYALTHTLPYAAALAGTALPALSGLIKDKKPKLPKLKKS